LAGFDRFSQVPVPDDVRDPFEDWSDPPRDEPPSPLWPLEEEPFRADVGRPFHGLPVRLDRSPPRPLFGLSEPRGSSRAGWTGRRFGGSPKTAVMAEMSGWVVPVGTPKSRWSRFTALALSGVTKLTTTPVAPALAVRPERWT
jgi:hypothetical protein